MWIAFKAPFWRWAALWAALKFWFMWIAFQAPFWRWAALWAALKFQFMWIFLPRVLYVHAHENKLIHVTKCFDAMLTMWVKWNGCNLLRNIKELARRMRDSARENCN
jgi:hypothetical protein